ncbi:hypothetical protein [Aliarcobacter lanthieri]|uniref:hypothetical protein n=1 Tax=Aliarcobacter lanthieri TaxID=1355374 RepID=UPI003AADEC5A
MKKIFILFAFTLSLYSHELMLIVEDNKDNTITVIGEFDTGESAVGSIVQLESLSSGTVLFKEKLPNSSELTIYIPDEPYRIVLDDGSHKIVREGILKVEGLKVETKKDSSAQKPARAVQQSIIPQWDSLNMTFFAICLGAFLLAIYFSNKNTNRILNELKSS